MPRLLLCLTLMIATIAYVGLPSPARAEGINTMAAVQGQCDRRYDCCPTLTRDRCIGCILCLSVVAGAASAEGRFFAASAIVATEAEVLADRLAAPDPPPPRSAAQFKPMFSIYKQGESS